MNWIKQIQSNGTLQIEDEQLYFFVPPDTSSAQSMARWATVLPVADYKISYDQIWFEDDNVSGSSLYWETRFRWDISSNSYYAVEFRYFTNEIRIARVTSSVNYNVVASTAFSNWIPGNSYHVDIYMRGSSIDVFVDGTQVFANIQDESFTEPGYVGIGVKGVQTPASSQLNPNVIGISGSGNNILNANGLLLVDGSLTTFNCFSPGSKIVTVSFDPSSLSLDPNKNLYFRTILKNTSKQLAASTTLDNLILHVKGTDSGNVSNSTALTTTPQDYTFGGQNDTYWGFPETITGQDIVIDPTIYATLHYNSPSGNQVTQDCLLLTVGNPNGIRWDNFAIEFATDYALTLSGTYQTLKISIPASGGISISGNNRIALKHTVLGGISVSSRTKVGRKYLVQGGGNISGSALNPRKYRTFGGVSVASQGKLRIGMLPSGKATITGQAYPGRTWRMFSNTVVVGEGLPGTTTANINGTRNFNWKTYLVGIATISGDPIYQVATRKYHYISSGGLNLSGVFFTGRKIIGFGGTDVQGTYSFSSIDKKKFGIGGVYVSSDTLTSKGYGGSGKAQLSGNATSILRRWDYTSSSTMVRVVGSTVVKLNRYKYLPDLSYSITQVLNGSKIKPFPVSSFAFGIYQANIKNNTLTYSLEFSLPTSTPTAIKLYTGTINENGTLLLDLTPFIPNLTSPISGTLSLSNAIIEQFVLGNIYIVVESDVYPSGEIRAQLTPDKPLIVSSANFVAIVKRGKWNYIGNGGIVCGGESIVRTGIKNFHYVMSREFEFTNNLTGDQVIPPCLSIYEGTVNLTIEKKLSDFYTSTLTGSQVVPPSGSVANGVALLDYDVETRILSWTILHNVTNPITEITLNAPGLLGVNAPVVVNIPYFSDDNTSSPVIGSCRLRPDQYSTLLSGTYLTINTTVNPLGEIRGQLIYNSTSISSDLIIVHNIPETEIKDIKLYSPKTDGFFAPVAFNLSNYATSFTSPIRFIRSPLSRSLASQMLNGQAYIQINTFTNPNGELRCDLNMTNGSLVIPETALIKNRAIGNGYFSIQGQAYITRKFTSVGGPIITGSFQRNYHHIATNGLTISSNTVIKNSMFGKGNLTISGSGYVSRKYIPYTGVVLNGDAVVSKIFYLSGRINISGTYAIKYSTWKYNGSSGITMNGHQLIRSTWKYNVSGGVQTSGKAIPITDRRWISAGTILVNSEGIYRKNHYKYSMSSGISVNGISLIADITRNYNLVGTFRVSGIAVIYKIKFPSSNRSRRGTSSLLLEGASKEKLVITPVRMEIDSDYCEYTPENQNEKLCPNGAWVSSKVRKTQRNYMPTKAT